VKNQLIQSITDARSKLDLGFYGLTDHIKVETPAAGDAEGQAE
jgi:hypothetical protein